MSDADSNRASRERLEKHFSFPLTDEEWDIVQHEAGIEFSPATDERDFEAACDALVRLPRWLDHTSLQVARVRVLLGANSSDVLLGALFALHRLEAVLETTMSAAPAAGDALNFEMLGKLLAAAVASHRLEESLRVPAQDLFIASVANRPPSASASLFGGFESQPIEWALTHLFGTDRRRARLSSDLRLVTAIVSIDRSNAAISELTVEERWQARFGLYEEAYAARNGRSFAGAAQPERALRAAFGRARTRLIGAQPEWEWLQSFR